LFTLAASSSTTFAAAGSAQYPLIAPEGGKEPLRAEYSPYSRGSDHDVYQDSSFAIPSIYLNDWPDRYIHTNFDTAANIDPTKLKRAALIGAASGYFLASFSQRDIAATTHAMEAGKLLRSFQAMQRGTPPAPLENYERAVLASINGFGSSSEGPKAKRNAPRSGKDGSEVYRRAHQPRGPMEVFGYDYFTDHARSAGIPTPKLLSYEGTWGSGGDYAYEALNLVDGKRSAREIADELTAEYGPVPAEPVIEYLRDLKTIGVLEDNP